MEEKNEKQTVVENMGEKLRDVYNITQMLSMSLSENQDDAHIIRSVDIISRMIRSIIYDDFMRLKEAIGQDIG